MQLSFLYLSHELKFHSLFSGVLLWDSNGIIKHRNQRYLVAKGLPELIILYHRPSLREGTQTGQETGDRNWRRIQGGNTSY